MGPVVMYWGGFTLSIFGFTVSMFPRQFVIYVEMPLSITAYRAYDTFTLPRIPSASTRIMQEKHKAAEIWLGEYIHPKPTPLMQRIAYSFCYT
jgi:hypothetical protein